MDWNCDHRLFHNFKANSSYLIVLEIHCRLEAYVTCMYDILLFTGWRNPQD
jgi:hypothetical protein